MIGTTKSVVTVANTIFPQSLYVKYGAPEFYALDHRDFDRLTKTKRWGRYFERMTRRVDGDSKAYNPLETIIEKLRKQKDARTPFKAAYELPLYNPNLDRKRYRDAPCLSFLSFKRHPERGLMLTAIFAGLRASEIRGLQWEDVDLKRGRVHVRQRADKFKTIGKPKSEAGERTVPMPPILVNALREWKLACPPCDGNLVFPTRRGVISHHISLQRSCKSVMRRARIVDKNGKAKYSMHAFRHFFASWCLNRRPEGRELPPKTVQALLGHSSIVMTMDTYGHLFPSSSDRAELAQSADTLLA